MNKSLIINASQIVTPKGFSAIKGKYMNNLTIIEDGAIAICDDKIEAIGTTNELLDKLGSLNDYKIINADGKCILPGFVDSHTHFIFGGYRPIEFINRINGTPYLDILKAGGGIQNTVNSTRNSSFISLYESAIDRLNGMLSQGITTIESKSGYGLDLNTELKQLKVSNLCNNNHPIDIINTYLGAHAVPIEFSNKNNEYINFMIEKVLPIVKQDNLAEFCDVFCEDSVFSIEESRTLLTKAKDMGFKLKLHADEIISLGGAELAGELKAVSADHLLAISDKGINSMIENNVIATLLPCTAFCLNKPYAPARKLIDSGASVALATDFNPGSCFTNSIPLVLALATIHMNMTINEAITAITLNGAAAIDKANSIGSIEVGKKADLVILKYPDYRFLIYNTGINIVDKVVKNGIFY